MIRGDDIYNWESMGASLANLSDDEQGQFFGGFLREVMSWKVSNFQQCMQLAFIGRRLSEDEKELLAHACTPGEK